MTPLQFFKTHAPYSYLPLYQTPEQGQRECALILSRAERWASATGHTCRWQVDPDTTAADSIDGVDRAHDYDLWECYLLAPDGRCVASLHGIDFGPDGEPWGDPYRRVVEAELASEAKRGA